MNLTCTAPIGENDLRLLLIIVWVTVEWETGKAGIFRIKTWKWHQNGKNICSSNPTFFRSITWNPLYLFSISWHYPFKLSQRSKLCGRVGEWVWVSEWVGEWFLGWVDQWMSEPYLQISYINFAYRYLLSWNFLFLFCLSVLTHPFSFSFPRCFHFPVEMLRYY